MELPSIKISGYFHSDLSFPGQTITKKRIVREYELEYILQDGDISYVDNIGYPVRKHTVLVAKPGQIRYSHFRSPLQTMYLRLVLRDELAERVGNLPDIINIVHTEQIGELFRDIIDFSASKTRDDLLIGGKLLILLHSLIRDAAVVAENTEKIYPIVHRAKQYIDSCYAEPISGQEIAERLNLSEPYLRTLFRSIYGITLHQYLCETRLRAARQMLSNTTVPIKRVAVDCGFGSLQYFTSAFHKEVGVSPRDYRKKMAQQYDV